MDAPPRRASPVGPPPNRRLRRLRGGQYVGVAGPVQSLLDAGAERDADG